MEVECYQLAISRSNFQANQNDSNMLTRKFLEELEYKVTGACIEVHKRLGPGLLENVYQQCLIREFEFQNILFSSQHLVNVSYRDMELDTLLRADFLIEDSMVIEIKAVDQILPIHKAQLLTYMKLLKVPKGLLINFNCNNIIHEGKNSFVNDLYRDIY